MQAAEEEEEATIIQSFCDSPIVVNIDA